MILKTRQGKLLVDSRRKACKGYVVGKAGFKAQINALKQVLKDCAR